MYSMPTVRPTIMLKSKGLSQLYGDVYVKFIPLVIPGGLAKCNTFWIDLNRGVRAFYFPARFIYHPDAPGDTGYAKISFVENSSRLWRRVQGVEVHLQEMSSFPCQCRVLSVLGGSSDRSWRPPSPYVFSPPSASDSPHSWRND